MSYRVPNHFKEVAQTAADFLHSSHGKKCYQALQMSGLAGLSQQATAEPPFAALRRAARPASSDTVARIGTWVASADDIFVRAESQQESAYPGPSALWADTAQFSARKTRNKRVLLIGESVARGFVLDPWRTPASVLQGLLDARNADTEVIDLACTGISATALLQLTQAAMQLEPDEVVVFAGNNWWNAYWSAGGQAAAHSLLGKSMAEVRRHVDEELAAFSRATLQRLAKTVGAAGGTLVLVVPAFNLRDWYGEALAPNWLSGPELAQWQEWSRLALQYEADGAWTPLKDAAGAMLRIDQGCCPMSLDLLGRAFLGLGDTDNARRCLEQARDHAVWSNLPNTPRCPRVIQEEMRQLAAEHPHLRLVDLPQVFSVHGGHPIPGRELFLDYVHMTPEGVELAMAHVAGALLGQSAAPALRQPPPIEPPDDRIEWANACFLSALHAAHCGQPDEIIGFWLGRALDADLAVIDSISAHFALVRNPLSRNLLKETQRPPSAVAGKFLRAFGLKASGDVRLAAVLTRVLSARDLPIPAALNAPLPRHPHPQYQAEEIAFRRMDGGRWDAMASLDDVGLAYVKERSPVSSFVLTPAVAGKSVTLSVRLSWSAPHEPHTVTVRIGNSAKTSFVLNGPGWHALTLPWTGAEAGRLDILWPLPDRLAVDSGATAMLDEGGGLRDFFFTYGHIAAISLT
jgi:hypothetical protein